ncbi:hypothetical protein LTR08_000296 [Meristemomyces frigidus]|nr:hypothetical protein LTR08_000296 [Meristemomyces frigidus]
MTAHLLSGPGFGFPPTSFGDPAFEPQCGFDFDDSHDEALRQMQHSMKSLQSFETADYNFDMMNDHSGNGGHNVNHFDEAQGLFPVGTHIFTPPQSMSSHTNAWSGIESSPVSENDAHSNDPRAASLPQDISSQRRGAPANHHGQITPPDEDTVELEIRKSSAGVKKSQAPSVAKMDNSQRARNAANQRHAKTKEIRRVREDSKQLESASNSGEEMVVGSKREKYREKNRLAAAKCRMKKKDNVQELEERSREMSAENNFARIEMRQLRDELTCLRTMALHHAAHIQGCNCVALHAYNAKKAGELANEWSLPATSSRSDSMDSVEPSPASFDTAAEHHSVSSRHREHPGKLSSSSSSSSSSSNYEFMQRTASGTMPLTAPVGDNSQYSFSGYLRNATGGATNCS